MYDKKIDIINGAYSRMRISGLTISPTPEDLSVALMRLETMAEDYYERGLCLSYNFEQEPDPNSESGVPRAFMETFETNLALRLLSDFGKPVPNELMMRARASYALLQAKVTRRRQTRYPRTMPYGSGTYRFAYYRRFFNQADRPPLDCDTKILRIDEIQDYEEPFDDFLRETETISSYTIASDTNYLTILSDSNTDTVVNYRAKASVPITTDTTTYGYPTIIIVITTSTGRVKKKVIPFQILSDNEV